LLRLSKPWRNISERKKKERLDWRRRNEIYANGWRISLRKSLGKSLGKNNKSKGSRLFGIDALSFLKTAGRRRDAAETEKGPAPAQQPVLL